MATLFYNLKPPTLESQKQNKEKYPECNPSPTLSHFCNARFFCQTLWALLPLPSSDLNEKEVFKEGNCVLVKHFNTFDQSELF